MRTTITIDKALFEKASAIADDSNVSSLVTKALEMMIAAESRKRILRLSGSSPDFTIPERDARGTNLGLVAEDEESYKTS